MNQPILLRDGGGRTRLLIGGVVFAPTKFGRTISTAVLTDAEFGRVESDLNSAMGCRVETCEDVYRRVDELLKGAGA